MNKIILLVLAFFQLLRLEADEGMWLPLLLDDYNIEIMQSKGFKLSSEDIYSLNKACMKDAIVRLSSGCTGEIISGEGLMLTNHHCGLRYIQNHSTIEHDYLKDGFWAMSHEEELANPELSVDILVRIEDVSLKIIESIKGILNEKEKQDKIEQVKAEIIQKAIEGTHYEAEIEAFYYGNQYYLFVMERFNDVRLVGAPPNAIGNFGGDTDNWMWPRHTGDFSIFRIYADENNKPTSYAEDNVPYKPKKYFPISLNGVKENDFTMVFGYPGSTRQYLPSFAIEMLMKVRYPERIRLRDKKLEIINASINTDPKIRIQYTPKAKRISNSWKRWKGEIEGLKKLNAIKKKKDLENNFANWIQSDSELKTKYGDILPEFKNIYLELEEYGLIDDYFYELTYQGGMEVIDLLNEFDDLLSLFEQETSSERKKFIIQELKKEANDFFKDYDPKTGKRLFGAILQLFIDNVPEKFQPEEFKRIKEKYNSIDEYVDEFFSKTFLVNKKDVEAWLDNINEENINKFKNDPYYIVYRDINKIDNEKLLPKLNELNRKVDDLMKLYISALMIMSEDRLYYPDANSTLRVAYGQVKGYKPKDGVSYNYFCTLEGIIEKDNPEIYDYDVPERLKDLFYEKKFGKYGENGTINVCFLATNHTTGGNSGSPVLNANGELIGVNFDRAWDGVMSDLMYNPELSRNISVDIRYILFIIDKYAGAKYLLDEMTLIE